MDELKTRRARRRSAAPTTPDPVEIAMEAEASGKAPTGEAAALLRRQSILIDEQIGLARNERFRNRIRSVRDMAIAALVVALIGVVGTAVWSAARTTGLVIQPFSVPPELAEEGLDGRAVAALVQDELIRLEAATESFRPATSFRNDWSEAITIEVEAGGLSLTDTYRALTRWLGRETYVGGSLRQTTAGLELVVRTSDGAAITVQGPAERPEALLRQAAERFYEQNQPYRYAIYLRGLGDTLPAGPERQALIDRRQAILTTLTTSMSDTERLWGYNGLAVSFEEPMQSGITLLQAALEIDQEHPLILQNLASFNFQIGHDEAGLHYIDRTATAVSAQANRRKIAADRRVLISAINDARLADARGDWLQALELRTAASSQISIQIQWSDNARDRVDTLIALHQPSAALRVSDSLALETRPYGYRTGTRHIYLPRAGAAASLDQWPQAVAALEAWEAEWSPTIPARVRSAKQTFVWPQLAYARARIGDLAGAQALIAATPLDCYLCVRERARIAELAGDRAAADRWSAEARRQGPSLPFAFAERGQMLMARGDPAGAIAFYEQAVERGPRWADPQKYWGDALMAQGDEAGAIRKYRAAADRAPHWGALHLAWGRALEAQGSRDQAREKYAQAARMDLSAADRAEVTRRIARVSVRP